MMIKEVIMNVERLNYSLYCLTYATDRSDYGSMAVWARDVSDTIHYLEGDVNLSNERNI